MKLRLSSRQSELAKVQAYQVGRALEAIGHEVEYLFRESLGDKNLSDPLWKMPDKGVFTEDFFQDLAQNKTDLVVHSWKDLPSETRPETQVIASLPRADQRDLLLFKKKSKAKENIKIFSSSLRRAHNLKPFFSWALPWKTSSVVFESVRGNIPTRIEKLMNNKNIDALVLAKAALDRLLSEPIFEQTAQNLRQNLSECDWMVLPLMENPNAAAQGALAIEISTTRPELVNIFKQINCSETFFSASREREILKEYGGGCHLALGMSVLTRSYGQIEIVKGLSPSGDAISALRFKPTKERPTYLKVGRLKFTAERVAKNIEISGVDAVLVAKAEAFILPKEQMFIWSAGLETWKKLAKLGVWVHGSNEALGEAEDARIETLVGRSLKWGRMTHDQVMGLGEKLNFASYHLELEVQDQDLGDFDAYVWESALKFKKALEKFPELRHRFHICGPGRTFDVIKNELASSDKIYVELRDEFI